MEKMQSDFVLTIESDQENPGSDSEDLQMLSSVLETSSTKKRKNQKKAAEDKFVFEHEEGLPSRVAAALAPPVLGGLRTRAPFRSSVLALKIQDHIDMKNFRNRSKDTKPSETDDKSEVLDSTEEDEEIEDANNAVTTEPEVKQEVTIDFSALHLSRTLLRAVNDLGTPVVPKHLLVFPQDF